MGMPLRWKTSGLDARPARRRVTSPSLYFGLYLGWAFDRPFTSCVAPRSGHRGLPSRRVPRCSRRVVAASLGGSAGRRSALFAQRLRGRMAPDLLAWRLGRARRVIIRCLGRVGPPARFTSVSCHDFRMRQPRHAWQPGRLIRGAQAGGQYRRHAVNPQVRSGQVGAKGAAPPPRLRGGASHETPHRGGAMRTGRPRAGRVGPSTTTRDRRLCVLRQYQGDQLVAAISLPQWAMFVDDVRSWSNGWRGSCGRSGAWRPTTRGRMARIRLRAAVRRQSWRKRVGTLGRLAGSAPNIVALSGMIRGMPSRWKTSGLIGVAPCPPPREGLGNRLRNRPESAASAQRLRAGSVRRGPTG